MVKAEGMELVAGNQDKAAGKWPEGSVQLESERAGWQAVVLKHKMNRVSFPRKTHKQKSKLECNIHGV